MTSDAVSPRKRDQESGRQLSPEQAAAAAMVAEAKARGPELTGPNGLLKLFTKNVLETALNEELTERLGRPKHHVEPGRESANVRNGSRPKTAISDAAGEVTFEPQIVKKRQRRLTDVDEIMLSLYAKGLTTGEISAHFAEIYGASVSKETISRITDTVIAEMQDWAPRPLDGGRSPVSPCSSTRSWSRSGMGRWPTGPSTPPSGSAWTAVRMCWACGWAAVARARRSG